MTARADDRILDFAATGMWWEITKSTSDTCGEFFEAINVIAPGFAGPPLHVHPHAEESYHVMEGTLDVYVGGEWRQLGPGDSASVPAGTAHTLKNPHPIEARLLNVLRLPSGHPLTMPGVSLSRPSSSKSVQRRG